jgi:hypothetical protein
LPITVKGYRCWWRTASLGATSTASALVGEAHRRFTQRDRAVSLTFAPLFRLAYSADFLFWMFKKVMTGPIHG